jgi:hypothetical protein
MRMADHVTDEPGLKLVDGLYEFDGGGRIWVEDGRLFLPMEVLHPLVILACRVPVLRVEYPPSQQEWFVRACDVVRVAPEPELVAGTKVVAKKFHLTL